MLTKPLAMNGASSCVLVNVVIDEGCLQDSVNESSSFDLAAFVDDVYIGSFGEQAELSAYRKNEYTELLGNKPISSHKCLNHSVVVYFPNRRIQFGHNLLVAVIQLAPDQSRNKRILNSIFDQLAH